MSWIRNGFEGQSSARRACSIAAMLTKHVALRIGYGLFCTLVLIAWLVASFFLAYQLDRLVSWYVPYVEGYVILPGLLALAAMWTFALVFFRKKTRRRRNEADATRWLAERSGTPSTMGYLRWQRRAKRWSTWGPAAVAIVVLLFYPETFGIASHLFHPGAWKLGQYRVQIPITWIVVPSWGDDEEFSSVHLLKAKGIARDWQVVLRISAVGFRSRHPQLGQQMSRQPKGVKITSTRTFPVGNGDVTCWEYTLDHIDWEYGIAAVACSSPGGEFGASFFGQKTDIPDFYRVIQGARRND